MCCFDVNLSVLLLLVLYGLPSCRAMAFDGRADAPAMALDDRPFWYHYDEIKEDYDYVEYDLKTEEVIDTYVHNTTDKENYDTDKYRLYTISYKDKVSAARNDCPKNATCARKCCHSNWGYDLSNNTCVSTDREFHLPVYEGYATMNTFAFDDAEPFIIINRMLYCHYNSEIRIPVTEISQYFHINAEGKLDVEISSTVAATLTLSIDKYCVDLFVSADGTTAMDALICLVPDDDLDIHHLMSGICMIVTCFLVLLRVVVFAWIPELQTLHGMILMAYLISFLVGFLLLGMEQFLIMQRIIEECICVTLTLIAHFFTLSAYFWRNVMCYDMWWTFRSIRAMSCRSASSRKRFRFYCAYAFGGPVVLTIALASIEFLNFPTENPLTPRIRMNCFLTGYARLLYLLGPLMILFVVNIVFFTLTALKISAIKKQNATILQTKDSCTQRQDTRQFTLYAKLFGSMAFLEINLFLEVITILHSDYMGIFHLSDAFNVLVPLIIVVNFLCRRQSWKMINRRYRQMRNLPMSPAQSTGCIGISQSSQEESTSVSTHI